MITILDSDRTFQLGASPGPEDIIDLATNILAGRLRTGPMIGSPSDSRNLVRLRIGDMEREAFHVLFLNTAHCLIHEETLFLGTIDSATVHPREIVCAALKCNASAVVLAHNHPSGNCEPSAADRALTDRIKLALGLIDVRVLDHIVVSRTASLSFAERGLL